MTLILNLDFSAVRIGSGFNKVTSAYQNTNIAMDQ